MGRPRKSVAKDTPKAKVKEPKEPEEETENLSLTLTRSRRTPKPNPKYSNDVIVPFSSKAVAGDSSRSTTPAKSETSEEVVPLSEEEEDESPKVGTRKRGRPGKKPSVVTPPAADPPKKTTPQTKGSQEKKEPPRRLPDRATKQQAATPPEPAPPKRKRDEDNEDPVVARVDAYAKKRIKALEEKLRTPTPPKVTPKPPQPPRVVEKRPAPVKNPSPAKGEIVDVAGTRENVKIVDVTEILNKKHEVEEPKRLRKCPPEAPKGPRPLYSSKILSQAPKVAPKLSPVSPRKPAMLNRLVNNGKLPLPRFPEVRKMPPLASRCPVIDLTAAEALEKPKRALKEALAASARKPQPLVPLRPIQRPLVKPIPPRPRQKREITCIETWYMVQMPAEKPSVAAKVTLGIGIKELGEQIKDIRLPSGGWSHSVQESSVAFQRSSDDTKDRSVTFKAKDLIIEIDGHEITLVGAPESLTTAADIQTLLQIVDEVSLKNSCVEQVTVVL